MKYEYQELQGLILATEEIQKNIEIFSLKNPKNYYDQWSHP